MRIVGSKDGGRGAGRGATTLVWLRGRPTSDTDALRSAIADGRAGAPGVAVDEPPLFVLPRGFSATGRVLARTVVGVGVVVVTLGAVVAFLAPSTAASVLGFAVAPAIMAVVATVAVAAIYDTGVEIRRSGQMRTEGWQGIREVDLRSFAEVTVTGD